MVTHDDIRNIANLAKLYVAEEDLDSLTEEMDKIIAFADTISAANAENSGFDNINNLQNAFRKDTVIPSFDRKEILQNAQDTDEGCFVVKNRL